MDPSIRRLLDLVEIVEAPLENLERYKQGATVTIKTSNGASFTNTVYAPRGSAVIGIDWVDVNGKFNALCPFAGVSASKIEHARQIVKEFREVKHVRELVDLLN